MAILERSRMREGRDEFAIWHDLETVSQHGFETGERLRPVEIEQRLEHAAPPDTARHDALLRDIEIVGMKITDDRRVLRREAFEAPANRTKRQTAKIGAGADRHFEAEDAPERHRNLQDAIHAPGRAAKTRPAVE